MTRDAGRILTAYRELEVGALIVGDSPNWRLDRCLWRGEGFRAGTRGHPLRDGRDDRAADAGDDGDWVEGDPILRMTSEYGWEKRTGRAAQAAEKGACSSANLAGLKPDAYFAAFAARVNSCPDT